ncbi:MAG: polysulfide reductase NrfD [Acidobacteriota bacterium]|nr:polysulfide reductase NrfD [Acidobacteriota bacterium]
MEPLRDTEARPGGIRWGKVVDHESCIGCHACSTACKSENEVPLSVNRTYVKYVDVGAFPAARRAFQVTRCNQCADSPCTAACPTAAMFARDDGIVDFDKSICIGCKACMAACPYDAIFINPQDHSAEKCNFCAHRVDVGLEPACVVVCPTEALMIGDLDDPGSRVAQMVHREPVTVRRPEKATGPKLFYRGAHQATLDPLAARRPQGGLFLWSEQLASAAEGGRGGPEMLVAGHPGQPGPGAPNSSAAALLSYDVPHRIPWDWRVSLYTLTKSIAAGAYLALFFVPSPVDWLWRWGTPLVAMLFLALTGVLLLADLEHPRRFWMIFARPQWRSWLVRGAFVIAAYGGLLALHLLSTLLEAPWYRFIAPPAALAAAATAVYTGYLFAQARARDLWQSPLLPPHLLVQALLAGSAVLLLACHLFEPRAVEALGWVLAVASLVHLLLVAGEITLPHGTAHAALAVREMTTGRYRNWFWPALLGAAAGCLVPWLAPPAALVAAVAAVAGLGLYEHAYVQAGQCVPLA